jgi:3-oxoadipate enol-lactonase
MAPTPIVFLHAFPLHGAMWRGEVEEFGERVTIAPDLPGFGDRIGLADQSTIDDFADTVVSDLDGAGIERAVIVGLSMGGYVAFRLGALHPERVAGLVLADTRAGPDTDEGAARRTRQAERARREGVDWLVEEMPPALLGDSTRAERPEVVAAVRRMIAAADPDGVARALLAMRDRPDSIPALAEIEVPVLALAGEEDTLTPVEEARKIAEGVRLGELAIIPRAGHLANLENPAAFSEAVRGFLQRHDL